MDKQDFIESIAGYVKKYAPAYEIRAYSPIIAQAILESGWGESSLAAIYHNYFGLKCGTLWKGKSVNLATKEEYSPGTLTEIRDNFRVYDNMEAGVKGYFEFIQLARYQNLKGITDPRKYLETIRADGYATSSTYVADNMALIEQYALTQYDTGGGTETMTKAEKAIRQMEEWADDDSHGYDQTYRWGEKGDYDCSAAVIEAWELAGVPVKTKGATYTGNMLSTFKACGFKDVTSQINLATGAGLIRSDVLLNTVHHTAMYCGDGDEVEASINENGGATGGKPGDQTGREFLIRPYRNYPWTHVLRYTEGAQAADTSGLIGTCTPSLHTFIKGAKDNQVKAIQILLRRQGFRGKDGKKLTVDGELGDNTAYAIEQFQRKQGMKNINFGTVAAKTWELLLNNAK